MPVPIEMQVCIFNAVNSFLTGKKKALDDPEFPELFFCCHASIT